MKERARHKPDSVILSGIEKMAVIYLGCLLPNTSSGTSMNGTGKRPTVVPATLLPTGVYRASASRHCWCALTAPLHPYL